MDFTKYVHELVAEVRKRSFLQRERTSLMSPLQWIMTSNTINLSVPRGFGKTQAIDTIGPLFNRPVRVGLNNSKPRSWCLDFPSSQTDSITMCDRVFRSQRSTVDAIIFDEVPINWHFVKLLVNHYIVTTEDTIILRIGTDVGKI